MYVYMEVKVRQTEICYKVNMSTVSESTWEFFSLFSKQTKNGKIKVSNLQVLIV